MKNSILTTLCLIWCALPCAADVSIPGVKLLADSITTEVSFSSMVVTYAEANYFYIEDDNRTMGIRVEKTAHGLTVGMRADVTGTMKTNTATERNILASSAVQTPAPNDTGVIRPFAMNNKAIVDPKITGFLIKTWGKYKYIDATTFEIDDGAGMNIICTVPVGTFLYNGWQYVSVVGILSKIRYNAAIYPPLLLVRDIDVRTPVEAVSIPNTPSGNAMPSLNVSYTYSTSGSTCNRGHPVEYSFNWGDDTSSPWSTSKSASHSWSVAGTKTITVTARCKTHPTVSATSVGLQVNVDFIEMISIPGGYFDMGNSGVGNDATYRSSYPQELPQHSVYLSAYSIGKYEITRGQYRQFMNAGGYTNSSYWSTAGWSWKGSRTEPNYWAASQDWWTGVFTQTENHPVVGVAYYEAAAFCKWAGGRLPAEAQWERAARWTGSHPNVYPWGDASNNQYCNNFYDSNIAGGGYQKYQTSPVGSYSLHGSPSGCQDMAGNVCEWCVDWYKSYPGSTSPFDYTNTYRVLRGGYWESDEYNATRCAYRTASNPNNCNYGIGFRLVR